MNGIPVLNLRHLCYLLDIFTQPHTSRNPLARDDHNQKSLAETGIATGAYGPSLLPDSVPLTDVGVPGPEASLTEPIDLSTEDSMSIAMGNCSMMTSFKDIETGHSTMTEASPSLGTDTVIDMLESYSEADREVFKQFTRESPNLYDTTAEEESLLLDCENFINFELDQSKTIVLNIKDAKEHSHSILKQHAITHPRSTDLPTCPFISSL